MTTVDKLALIMDDEMLKIIGEGCFIAASTASFERTARAIIASGEVVLKADVEELVTVLRQHDKWYQDIGEVAMLTEPAFTESGYIKAEEIRIDSSAEYNESPLRERTVNALTKFTTIPAKDAS